MKKSGFLIKFIICDFGNRLSQNLGTHGIPRLHHLWNSGPPTNFGGQAPPDYSEFDFIGLYV
jgi:hypothetical protein